MNNKIAFCGSHGTGKTTLLKELEKELNLPIITGVLSSMWEKFGVSDFNLLPANIRWSFQKEALLTQIDIEDDRLDGFISDRSVLDILAYAQVSSFGDDTDKKLFEKLVRERLKNYTHLVYCPIEFEFEARELRANQETRKPVDMAIKKYLQTIPEIKNIKLIKVSGTPDQRLKQVTDGL